MLNIKNIKIEPNIEINILNLIVDIFWLSIYAIWCTFYIKSWNSNDLNDLVSGKSKYVILLLYMISIFYSTFEIFINFIVDLLCFNKSILISSYKKMFVLNNKIILSVFIFLNIVSKIIPLLLIPKITTQYDNCTIDNIVLCIMGKIGGVFGLIYLLILALPTIGLFILFCVLFCSKKYNIETKKSLYHEIRKRLFPRRIIQKLSNLPIINSVSLIRLLSTYIGNCSMCFKYGEPCCFELECSDVFCFECVKNYIDKTKKCAICNNELSENVIMQIHNEHYKQTTQKINVFNNINLL